MHDAVRKVFDRLHYRIERPVPAPAVLALLQRWYPQQTEHQLMRVGTQQDGGYLLPDALDGIRACFSPGVAQNASFEVDLQRRFGIGSHLADWSVDGPPQGFSPLSFDKLYLGPVTHTHFISLDDWVVRHAAEPSLKGKPDLLLQMDIEGAEYSTLLAASPCTLDRVRILVLELHGLTGWNQPQFHGIASAFTDKLLQHFEVLHLHPNNNDCTELCSGIDMPRTVEVTLMHRACCQGTGTVAALPHALDADNVTGRPPVVISAHWRPGTLPAQG